MILFLQAFPSAVILSQPTHANLGLNDSELMNYLAKTNPSPKISSGMGSRDLDSTEEIFLLDESASPPPSNYSNTFPKALSLDILLSKWNPNFDEAEVTTEQLDVPIDQREPILTPRSQVRVDKKNKKQELQLEKAALRQRERDISNANKKSVDATQAWQDLTLLFDSEWILDTKVGQPLIALCEQDGAKAIEDPRMTIPFSLCWELKTTKRYDEARAMFVPLPRPVHLPVLKILLKWDASELLEWCLSMKGLLSNSTLDVAKFDMQIVKLSYPNYQTIAIVSGTQSLFRTIRTHVNRGFNSQVRALDGDAAPTSRTSRGSSLRGRHELIHIEYFEDFLIQLQLLHDIHIVQLETHAEVIDFIYAMTKEISAIPHRPQETRLFANLPELSTRKSDSAEETWRLILEQIYLVTPTVASAVTQAYPSFAALISALHTCESKQQKLALLSEIEVRPPTGRSRRLGENLASRILKAFTSSDPHLPIS
ncbi:putative crossover junction endonuclease eme2 [Entomophthora muscae]|uniref:Crossover junction endonuclease eme2 n=1 Tax=Entomophthora muscae TaxID=34485 RepID=A0ACC2ULI5_9FUNG|nr:putative crossover junction endonuclease eme2 [Entomophthora muscae]